MAQTYVPSQVSEAVINDIRERDALGYRTYGKTLDEAQIDPLYEAYQEALDLCQYLKKALMERDQQIEIRYNALELCVENGA